MFATITLKTRRSRAALAALLCAAGLPVAAVATAPEAAAVSPTAPTAYVVNTQVQSVSPVDTTTHEVGTAIPVAQGAIKAAITPDGATAYVLSGIPSNVVTPIDTTTNTAGTPIAVPFEARSLAITPDGSTVYVGNSASGQGPGSITPIDTATDTAGPAIVFPLPVSPRAIAITPDGTTAYVVVTDGSVSVIDLATNTLGVSIPLGPAPQDIAITPDGSLAFVPDVSNKVTPINLATNTAGAPIAVGGGPASVAITPDGTTAFVTTVSGGTVPIAVATGTAGSPIPTSGFVAIAITPDGATAYVTDTQHDTIEPIDVSTKTAGSPIAVGEAPQGIAISPDQAPVAHVTVTPRPPGSATSFDASASTVKYGTIAAYDWNFGDGATQTTSAPTTTHVYATGGNYPVSVTETDSNGTSTARVFTGQTMSRNGGPQATATATASIPGPAAWTAFVVNNVDNTVTPINLRTNVPGPAIPVGNSPTAVAITPDGKTAYVTNEGSNSVTPINTATKSPGPAIPVGSEPLAVAITPDGATAWVADAGDGTVTPINTATNTAGAPITIPLGVNRVTMAPDGATLYVTGDPNVTPVDLATNTVGAPIGNVNNLTMKPAITPNGVHLLTPNNSNFVTDLNLATNTRTTDFLLSALAGDVAITPNGTTAYVAYTEAGGGGVVPIDIATGAVDTKINMHKASTGAAITPDGKTAIVTNLFDRSVTLVSTVTNTVGATIPVGTNPFAVAVTPDGAPVARLHVDRAPLGQPATLDASASTTPFGTLVSYAWDFGDGTTATTTSPITHHVYNEATTTASVTLTNSSGTSTKRTFTGSTVSNNGGASATAVALGSLAASGPVVNSVLPSFGSTAGGKSVTITGSNLSAVTNVEFNGIPATFTHTSATSLSATTPAVSAAQIADVVVTSAAGSSALSVADRFTYTNATPTASCSSSLCVVHVTIPATPIVAYGTMNGSCSGCTVTIKGGLGALGGVCASTPQVVTTIGSSGASVISTMLAALTEPSYGATVVCAQGVPGLAGARASAAAATAAPAPFTVKSCAATNQKAPCVVTKVVSGGRVTTRIKLPANKSFKVEVARPMPKTYTVTPRVLSVGESVTVTGTNFGSVSSVVIGGVRALVLSRAINKLVMRIPDGAQTGPISLITPTGVVTTKSIVRITP